MIVSVPREYNPQPADFTSSEKWVNSVREYICHILQVKPVKWAATDYIEFRKVYDETS